MSRSTDTTVQSILSEYEEDQDYRNDRKNAHELRDQRRPILNEILSNFLEGQTSLTEFHKQVTAESFSHNAWRFTGLQGLLFFNQLVRVQEQEDLVQVLRRTLKAPTDISDAKKKIGEFASFVARSRDAAKKKLGAPQVGRSLFFLSFFWEKQNPDSPIYWPSGESELQALGLYSRDPNEDYGADYENYCEAIKKFAERTGVSEHTAEDVLYYRAWKQKAKKPPGESAGVEAEEGRPAAQASSYSLHDFAAETGMDPSVAERWLGRLRRKMHVVFQGPPGTGKTYVAERLAKLMVSGTAGIVDTVQFHPAYTYEDFVEGLRPEPNTTGFSLKPKPGLFVQFCRLAMTKQPAPCVLIIDELNRGNPARVFGELMYLLEYREKSIPLASEGTRFQIPGNVYIIGTMNTADRSIALVDHAFRRRFSFIRLNPDFELLRKRLSEWSLPADSLVRVLTKMNGTIKDPNYFVGISFFLKDGPRLGETLQDVWESEIEPYLEEYFFDQQAKVEPFRWNNLAKDELREWAA